MACGGVGESGAGASKDQDEAGRKRRHNKSCQNSRKRIREDKEKLKDRVDALKPQNAEAQMKIGSLDQEGSTLKEKLENLKTRKTELKVQIGENEKELAHQNEQLEHLSKHPNLELGSGTLNIEKLKNELAVLTQITWDDWEFEKSVLEKEISELKNETIKLKTHWRVLAEK